MGSSLWLRAATTNGFSSPSRVGGLKEHTKKLIYKKRDLATADSTDYIAFYNRTRRHNHLGGVSPEDYEATHVR